MNESDLDLAIVSLFSAPLSANADYDRLYRAAWFGDLGQFVRIYAQCTVRNFAQTEWYALLALIVDNNLVDFFVLILSGYVCIEAAGIDGKTMWHLAVEQQRVVIIDYLMQHYDRYQQTHRIADYAGNSPAIYALHLAKNAESVEDGQRWYDILHKLIEYDDAVFTDTDRAGFTLQYKMLMASAIPGPSLL